MPSISLFPCSFTPVETITKELCSSHGFSLFNDEDLLVHAAEQTGEKYEKLQHMLLGSTSVFNQFTLERERIVNIFKKIIAAKLETNETLLFNGFLSLLIPAKISVVLKVLIVASKQERTHYAMQDSTSTEKEAKKKIHKDDLAAFNWSEFLFHKEPFDSSLYDLIIPVTERSSKEIMEEILQTYHTTAILPTPDSLLALKHFKLEIEVERILLSHGHKLKITITDTYILLLVQKSVLNISRLTQELTDLIQPIAGQKTIIVKKDPLLTESIYRRQNFELPSKVLFVDDEKEFVKTVSERLISRDVGTYGVFSGEEALELLAKDRPDVMVLDLKMPGIHGVDVLHRTKDMAPEVEVIILTGHGSDEDRKTCLQLGAFAYMNKPVDIEELSATIKAAYTRIRARENL